MAGLRVGGVEYGFFDTFGEGDGFVEVGACLAWFCGGGGASGLLLELGGEGASGVGAGDEEVCLVIGGTCSGWGLYGGWGGNDAVVPVDDGLDFLFSVEFPAFGGWGAVGVFCAFGFRGGAGVGGDQCGGDALDRDGSVPEEVGEGECVPLDGGSGGPVGWCCVNAAGIRHGEDGA